MNIDAPELERLIKDIKKEQYEVNQDKTTMPQEVMSLMNVTYSLVCYSIGAGFNAIPFAIYQCGIFYGLVILILVAFLVQLSVMLLLKAKDLSPHKLESLYELGYLMFGRSSIFIICLLVLVGGTMSLSLQLSMISGE